ncbi:protein IDA-LIKE 2 [Sesamum angolense]|uniref:Protein IDA-LIKE 2 n=1 Tax=Sesamum angolense TaxID=2727404 RepID=A0AAE2BQA6_9LAMI|nr:protein IDA-LIKE 2 [Sesamum angolense]
MNGRSRLAVVLSAALVFLLVLGHCHASRQPINAFKIRPKPQQSRGHFLNFLPKRWVPASGPSRKHNDLGLQSWRFP